MALFYIIPNTDRLVTSWQSGPTGGVSRYTMIDDPVGTPDDLSTYIYNIAAVRAYFTGPSFTSNLKINSFSVFTRAYTNEVTYPYYATIRIGTTDYSNTARNNLSFENYINTWATNPATGLQWTASAINSLWFGINATFVSNKGFVFQTVATQIYGIVDCTTSGSGTILLCQ